MTARIFAIGLAVAAGVGQAAQALPLRDGGAVPAEVAASAPIVEVKKGGGHPGRALGHYGNPDKRKGWYEKGGPRFT